MGWKGVMRSVRSSVRQARKEELKRQKLTAKTQLMAFSAQAVTDLDTHMHTITSIHHSADALFDWRFNTGSLEEPTLSAKHDLAVQSAALDLAEFKPSIFQVFKGGARACLERLKNSHQKAVDARDVAIEKFNKDYEDWREHVSLINRAKQGEAASLKRLLQNIENLSEDAWLGRSINFEIQDGYVHAKISVYNSDIVPGIRRKQLASGRLSETKMPDAQFHEIYQDYVCSAAFRVGAELLNTVPLNGVFVTCHSDMLDTSKGYVEEIAILSVQFIRSTFENLNLKNVDPSDALNNFRHSMSFKRTKGFGKITPL